MRLDAAAGLVAGGNSGPAIVAGKSAESLLVRAVRGKDDEVSKMPPEGEAASARPRDRAARRAGSTRGHKLPTKRRRRPPGGRASIGRFSRLPADDRRAVKNPGWVRNPIDAFVLARLEAAGLAALAPRRSKATLIRRAEPGPASDLPPSLDEVDDFWPIRGGDAYERLVDRLLASPHYGERWGRHWLDVARYADSNGYTIDGGRSIWKYRDWVIGGHRIAICRSTSSPSSNWPATC